MDHAMIIPGGWYCPFEAAAAKVGGFPVRKQALRRNAVDFGCVGWQPSGWRCASSSARACGSTERIFLRLFRGFAPPKRLSLLCATVVGFAGEGVLAKEADAVR